jgi:hypothetical protein
MSIIQDGAQAFGISDPTIGTQAFVVESFSQNNTSNRVDLDDSNGEPLGSTTIPGRVEFSATVQFGPTTNTIPVIGSDITIDSVDYIITDVSVDESQADYQRISLSGYKRLNQPNP